MSHTLAHSLEDNTRTKDVIVQDDVSFESLFLSEDIFKGLLQKGFKKPSPIQLKAIPIGRCGFDLIVKSKSGTGKTLVFSIVALENIDRTKKELQALILAPTREIAVQIQDVIKQVGCNIEGLVVESFIGGLSFEDDKKKCIQCQIAVGTPGRIKHLICEGILTCDFIRLFVLDEADKLMETSFRNDINQVYNALPAKKQLITTSATYPNELDQFLAQYMQSPTHVNTELETPLLLGLKQFVSVLRPHNNVVQQMRTKNEELLNIFSNISFTQCLVFSNYQTRAESISNYLNQKEWNSMFISAAQSQSKRLTALNSLKDFKCRIMLSTDLTARGIDAANVDLVINYDIPVDAMTYLHRMGRAGRYGAQGVCLNLAFDGQDLEKLRKILGQIGGTALGIPKLPVFKGHITDLIKLKVPANEQIFGKIDDSYIDLALDKNKIYELKKVEVLHKDKNINIENINSQHFLRILNDSEIEKGEIEEQISNTQASSTTLISQSFAENKKCDIILNGNNGEDELKNQLADMDPQAILTLLVNQNVNMSTSKSAIENDTMMHRDKSKEMLVENDTLLALLDTHETKKPENKIHTVEIASEDQKRQQFFTRNKALLDVVRELDSPNRLKTNLDGSSIEQYLDMLGKQDEKNINEMSEKSLLDILDSIRSIDSVKENVPAEMETFDLENIFEIGYNCMVKSNNTDWKKILERAVKQETSPSNNPTDDLKDDEYESMEEDFDESEEVEIMKWVPVGKTKTIKAGENVLEDTSENDEATSASLHGIEDSELTKWMPPSSTTRKVQRSRLSESVSEEVNHYEHFSSYFEECDHQLWQNGLNFDNMNSFDEWFYYEWETQLCAMRNYVQQNIYVQEMTEYQNSKTNK